MSQQPCPNCPALARIIQQQQAEIAMLQRIIAEAQEACNQIETESGRVMAQHGSPYRYNIHKGRKDAALDIERRLKG